MDKRAAAQYLRNLFGFNVGHVAVAYKDKGDSWQESQFQWPADREKILAWAQIHHDANLFICPALRQDAHTRKKGDGVSLQWLWADVDWDKIPADRREVVTARIKDLGSYVVSSGSGDNRHVYVRLDRPVTVSEHLRLNTGLRNYLYADNKQSDNSLLRLPGTTNWKTESGSPVKALSSSQSMSSVDDLLTIRAFSSISLSAGGAINEIEWSLVETDHLPRRIRALATMDVEQAEAKYGNRHKAVWAVTGELHKRGLDADQIHSLMDSFPPAIEKRDEEHGAYDVHRDVEKRLLWDRANNPLFSEDDAGEVFEEMSVEDARQSLIEEGKERELLRRAIRRAADADEALAGHVSPPDDASEDLSDALSMPPEPVQYLIEGLCSAEGIVVITGQYKSGKTHLMTASLLTSLADNEPFLGSKAVYVPEEGAICGHWNLEMSRLDIVDKYLRPAQFKNPHNIKLAHWQGYRINLLTEPGRQHAMEWLTSRQVKVWTIDSWTALCRMCGVDPNDNKEVADLVGVITEIKVQASIQAVFILAHTARSSHESDKPGTRGASTLDEAVDTRWMFTVDRSDVRFLQAEGRGTQMSAISLDFNEETGRSTIGSVSRASAARDGVVQTVVKTIQSFGRPVNRSTLIKLLREAKVSVRQCDAGIEEAIESGFIEEQSVSRASGGRPLRVYCLTRESAPDDDRFRNATPREVNLSAVRRGKRP